MPEAVAPVAIHLQLECDAHAPGKQGVDLAGDLLGLLPSSDRQQALCCGHLFATHFGDYAAFDLVVVLHGELSEGGRRPVNGDRATAAVHAVISRAPDDEPIAVDLLDAIVLRQPWQDRKSTRLNSSHLVISYAVFCLKKKIIALLLVFRSVVAAILPALVGGSAVIVTLALVFGLGHLTTLSIFVLNITTLFGLGLGVDYSLFMVSRFREELARGRTVDDAVTITVATAGRAVTFSGLTVSIGLLGLIFFRLNMLHSVGYGGILVAVLAVLAAITLLPATLAIIGTRINAFPVRIPHLWKREEASSATTAYAT